jgi:hypothetical protein
LRARYSSAYVHLSLHLEILKCLGPELGLPQRARAACNRARRRPVAEYAVHARLAHFVVAFGVDLELHVGVEVARRLADRADV